MEARHWDWGRAIPELGFHVLDFSKACIHKMMHRDLAF
jgi:hypothetical protein